MPQDTTSKQPTAATNAVIYEEPVYRSSDISDKVDVNYNQIHLMIQPIQ